MRLLIVCMWLFVLPSALLAQASRDAGSILEALRVDQLLEIMESEAVLAGDELAEGVIPEIAMEDWRQTIARINAPDRLKEMLRDDFAEALPVEQVDPILDFMGSSQGQRFVGLELSAREALLNSEIEAFSLDILDRSRADDDPRLRMVRRFAAINDLIDSNVVGALNANAAFLRGMNAGVGSGSVIPMTDAEIVEQVWAQEPEIRRSTEDWVYSFLMLAYQPLSDAELETYMAFSESQAGQALTKALFKAFDVVFVHTSERTGAAVAQALASEDI